VKQPIRKKWIVQVEVYFDDFKVEHIKSPVISSQDYYPFGLAFGSYQRENSLNNQYKFNGIGEQDELGLNVLQAVYRTVDPTTGRWWQIDPKPDMSLSTYSFGSNNPLLYSDLLGDTVVLNQVNQGGIDGVKNIVNQGTGGFCEAQVDSNGKMSLVSTGQEGDMSSDQMKFANELGVATEGPGTATINVANNSEDVGIGKLATNTMDTGDMQKLGSDGKVTAQKALVYEVRENYESQVGGQTDGMAHQRGGNAENRTGGSILNVLNRPTTESSTIPGLTTTTIPVIGPASQRGSNVSISMYKNNVIGVTGNKIVLYQDPDENIDYSSADFFLSNN
jgi:RHS repeat-associated protein